MTSRNPSSAPIGLPLTLAIAAHVLLIVLMVVHFNWSQVNQIAAAEMLDAPTIDVSEVRKLQKQTRPPKTEPVKEPEPQPEPEPEPPQPEPEPQDDSAERERLAAIERQKLEEARQEELKKQEEARKAEEQAKKLALEKKKKEEELKKKEADARKKKAEEEKKKKEAEDKKKKEEEAKRKKAEEEKKKKDETEKKKREDAEKKKKEEELRKKKEAEARKREEDELARELDAEAEQVAAAARRSAQQGEIAKYLGLIANKVRRNWIKPENPQGLARLRIRLAPGGTVLEVISCEGERLMCESATRAVYKADPLPVPADPALFEENFKVFRFCMADREEDCKTN